jgi:hypothetical protein
LNPTPKTIQIYLPAGDPRGIRVAEITTRIVRVIEVPRSLLTEFLAMPEAGQVAVYLLFGGSDAANQEERKVYIGQTGDLRARLADHNKKKEFWERALVLVSLTNSLTQTHGLFLEWLCLQKAREARRYQDENGNGGSRPYTPPPLEADCMEIFDTARTLVATLGYPVFTPVREARTQEERRVYRCIGTGADGQGLYTAEGFVVLEGSVGRVSNVPSIQGTSAERFRARLIETGIVRLDGDRTVFVRDHLFGSPSMAAMALLGRTANGWEMWKAEDGKTLGQVERGDGDAERGGVGS